MAVSAFEAVKSFQKESQSFQSPLSDTKKHPAVLAALEHAQRLRAEEATQRFTEQAKVQSGQDFGQRGWWTPGGVSNVGGTELGSQYGNGRIPTSALTNIGGGHYLAGNAAYSFNGLRAEAQRQGIDLRPQGSYRNYATQVRLAQEKGLYSQGGLAATPGTSRHGLGLALDIQNPHAQAFMKRYGPAAGWKTIPREPWHWQYIGGSRG